MNEFLLDIILENRSNTDFYSIINVNESTRRNLILSSIKEFLNSEKARNMHEGVRYYNFKHDILDRVIAYKVAGMWEVSDLANERIKHPYHSVLVDQKVGYISGETWETVFSDETLKDIIEKEYLSNDQKMDLIRDLNTDASNMGRSWINYFYNKDGVLSYRVIDSREIIYRKFEGKEYIIRFYETRARDGKLVKKIQFYDENMVYYYTLKEDKLFLDPDAELNPRPHFVFVMDDEKVDEKGFDKVPFIKNRNNRFENTDLQPIKDLIDDIDLADSDWSNDNLNSAEDILVFTGIDSKQRLSELVRGIKANGGIKFENDQSKVERILNDVQYESKLNKINQTKSQIFELGMGVSTEKALQNTSGVALKLMFQNLDLKANKSIRYLVETLNELYRVIINDVNRRYGTSYTINDIDIIPRKQLIIDAKEVEEINELRYKNLLSLKGTVSDETILETLKDLNVIKDIDLEKERLENELNSRLIEE